MAKASTSGNLSHLINHIIKVIFIDSTIIQGELKGFDNYMNLLMQNCVEINTTKESVKKKQMGFVLIRGEQILATTVITAPLITEEEKKLIQKKKLEQLELKLSKDKLDKLKKFEKKKNHSIGKIKKSVEKNLSLKQKKSSGDSKKSKISVNLKQQNKKVKKATTASKK
ncbi:hypothetical protein QEN19_000929 [Hanseniaspora menglaensis]